jgi:hypothetical protein
MVPESEITGSIPVSSTNSSRQSAQASSRSRARSRIRTTGPGPRSWNVGASFHVGVRLGMRRYQEHASPEEALSISPSELPERPASPFFLIDVAREADEGHGRAVGLGDPGEDVGGAATARGFADSDLSFEPRACVRHEGGGALVARETCRIPWSSSWSAS